MSVVAITFTIYICINLSLSFTIGSYNTAQLELASPNPLTGTQIAQIAQSDFDVICLQELSQIQTAQVFNESLSAAYPYSFSELDVYDLSPRAPCTTQQASLFYTGCIPDNCNDARFNPDAIAECVATNCQSQFFDLIYTECFYCVGFCPILGMLGCPLESFASTATFCTNILPIPIDLLSGTAIFSKYPIVNQWIFDYPSYLLQRSFILTEIDVCTVTQLTQNTNTNTRRLLSSESSSSASSSDDKNDKCSDTIIVACVHLKDNDMIDPEGTYYPTTQEQIYQNIQSHVELNAYQSNWIFENILDANKVESDNNLLQFFVAGDFNVGELLNVANLELWYDYGFVNTKRIEGIGSVEQGGTYNAAQDSELPNVLARQNSLAANWVLFDRDLDQILAYNGDEFGIDNESDDDDDSENVVPGLDAISFDREFTQLFDVGGQQLPMSDHWGVSFEFEFK